MSDQYSPERAVFTVAGREVEPMDEGYLPPHVVGDEGHFDCTYLGKRWRVKFEVTAVESISKAETGEGDDESN